MKNLSLILNAVLLVAVAHLYYLNFSKKSEPAKIETAAAANDGVKIAYVNMDTIDAKYEWLKEQRAALEQSQKNKQASLKKKQDAFMRDMEAFQNKYQAQNTPPAQLEKEYNALQARQQKLVEEEQQLGDQLSNEFKKAMDDLMANVEVQLKSLQSQIGYDYILSYTRGGGTVLLANDSLEITNQVLELLNKKEDK